MPNQNFNNQLKLYRGKAQFLPGPNMVEYGACYFCEDTGDFYIGTKNSSGQIELTQINKEYTYPKAVLDEDYKNIPLTNIDLSTFNEGNFTITPKDSLTELKYLVSFENGDNTGAPTLITGNGVETSINWGQNPSGKQKFIDLIYPVGSIYMSSVNKSPQSLFGGRWLQIQGRFLLGAGTIGQQVKDNTLDDRTFPPAKNTSYTIYGNTVGGEDKHTLKLSEMPQHDHLMYINDDQALEHPGEYRECHKLYGGGTKWRTYGAATAYVPEERTEAHNNMPPFYSVYIWERLPDDAIL